MSAPASHPLRLAVSRHKARLNAELTKARLRYGFASLDAFRAQIEANKGDLAKDGGLEQVKSALVDAPRQWPHPRWVRINTLKTTLDEQLGTTFAGYKIVDSLEQTLSNTSSTQDEKILFVDEHVPNLLALPPITDLIKTQAYANGLIILQDKASCFPAYLLNHTPEDESCVDACAAPGNKTTHIAAILASHGDATSKSRIYACERDKTRALTLGQMVNTASAEGQVVVKAGQDFLRVDCTKAPWNRVGSLLLDPSCSGSGIVGRDDAITVTLPKKETELPPMTLGKKRKRKFTPAPPPPLENPTDMTSISEDTPADKLPTRLTALSTFQLKLLLHAFQFPRARKITYSTCSLYAEENEHVVMKALDSPIAKQQSWRILRRTEQVAGMRAWKIRGSEEACKQVSAERMDNELKEVAEACIRCEKGTKEGTQGFFVAALAREGPSTAAERGEGKEEEEEEEEMGEEMERRRKKEEEEGEWEGFSEKE